MASESAAWEEMLYNDPPPIASPERPAHVISLDQLIDLPHCLCTDNLPMKKRRRHSPSSWEGFDKLTVESSAAVEVAFYADKELCRVCWSRKGGGVCWYEYEGVSRQLYEQDMCSGAGFNGSIGAYLNWFKSQGHPYQRLLDLESRKRSICCD